MTGALYTVGWRVRGRPRRWLVNHFGSLDEAVRVARGNVRFDGGGRWRVYGMRLEVPADGSGAQSVRDRLLAEGLEPADGDPEERILP